MTGPLDPATTVDVTCPYCGEVVSILVDLTGGPVQEYVEDCQVCCRPWSVRVALDGRGIPSVIVNADDSV